jgi:hypothetical protein
VERFDEELRALGARLVPKVNDLRLDGEAEISAKANVLGEKVEATFWEEAGGIAFETSCSCGAGAFCEHGFAVLGKMAKEKRLARLFGRTATEAVTMAIGSVGQKITERNDAPEPVFELAVRKGAVDRATKLLLQSLGQKEPEEWIFGEAFVIYGDLRKPLADAGEGGKTPAEMRAIRHLRDTGLSSMMSNPAWRFLLSMKSRSVSAEEGQDKWFPDPGRMPVDAFWHEFRGEKATELEALGWRITFGEGVGHQVHEADPGKWETKLSAEEYDGDYSDGGWFSLSVGFDVAGVRHDLMPILAG